MKKLHKYVKKLNQLVTTKRSGGGKECRYKIEDVIVKYLLQIESLNYTFSCPAKWCTILIESMNTLQHAKCSQKYLPQTMEINEKLLTTNAMPTYITNSLSGCSFNQCTKLKHSLQVPNKTSAEFTLAELYNCVKTLMEERKEVNKLTFAEFINAIQLLTPLLLHIENTDNTCQAENTLKNANNESEQVAATWNRKNITHNTRNAKLTSQHHNMFITNLQLQQEYNVIQSTHVKWQPWVTDEIQQKLVHQFTLIEQDKSKAKNYIVTLCNWEHFIRSSIPSYYVVSKRVQEYLLTEIMTIAITNTQRQRKQFAIDLLRIIKQEDNVHMNVMVDQIIEWNESHTALRQRCDSSIRSSCYCCSSSTFSDDNKSHENNNPHITCTKYIVADNENNCRNNPEFINKNNAVNYYNNKTVNKSCNFLRTFDYSFHSNGHEEVEKSFVALANSRYSLFSNCQEYFYMALELLVNCVPTFYVNEQCIEEVYVSACNNFVSENYIKHAKVVNEYFPVVECLLDLPELNFALERDYSVVERELPCVNIDKTHTIQESNTAFHNKENALYANARREHSSQLSVQRKSVLSADDVDHVLNTTNASCRIRLHVCFAHHKKGAANALYKSSSQACYDGGDDDDDSVIKRKNADDKSNEQELSNAINENAHTQTPIPICKTELIHDNNFTEQTAQLLYEMEKSDQINSTATDKHCGHAREQEWERQQRWESMTIVNNEITEGNNRQTDKLTLSPSLLPTNKQEKTSEWKYNRSEFEEVKQQKASEKIKLIHGAEIEHKEEPTLEFDVIHALESDARQSCNKGLIKPELMQSEISNKTNTTPKFSDCDMKEVCDEKKHECFSVASNVHEVDRKKYSNVKSMNKFIQDEQRVEVEKYAKTEADELFSVLTSDDNINNAFSLDKVKSLDGIETEVEMQTTDTSTNNTNMTTSKATTKTAVNCIADNANSDVVERSSPNTEYVKSNSCHGTVDDNNNGSNKSRLVTEAATRTASMQNEQQNTKKSNEKISGGLAHQEQLHKNEQDNDINALRNLVEALLLQASVHKNKPLSSHKIITTNCPTVNDHDTNKIISQVERLPTSSVNLCSSELEHSPTCTPPLEDKFIDITAKYSSASPPSSSTCSIETTSSGNEEDEMLLQLTRDEPEKSVPANAKDSREELEPFERQEKLQHRHHADADNATATISNDVNNAESTDELTEGSLFGIRGSSNSNYNKYNTEQSMLRLRKTHSSLPFSSSLPPFAAAFNTQNKMYSKEKFAERRWENKSKSTSTCPWLTSNKYNNATKGKRSYNINNEKNEEENSINYYENLEFYRY